MHFSLIPLVFILTYLTYLRFFLRNQQNNNKKATKDD